MTTPTGFVNPIIPGFAPDPSVVLVDGVFFLVNSSFHVFPGLPIHASKNLKDWKHIGNAINRPEQLILKDANSIGFPIGPGVTLVATCGLFAPTIRWHKGTFYIICTNAAPNDDGENLNMQNFYVTTKDIWSGEWSDPIFFDFRGIDPSIFFDEDDRAYIQGSWRDGTLKETVCTIKQFEVDIATGASLSEPKELWKGFAGKKDAEGPHIYKKDGYYYLITAEAGTFEHHMICAARSTSLWGPYESYEKNPILTAFGTDGIVQNTGHGDLFQDESGAWWLTCLGVRNDGGRYPLGRETFLTAVSWPKDGWPAIDLPTLEFQRNQVAPESSGGSEFPQLKGRARVDDVYIRDPQLEDYAFSSDSRTISITPRVPTLSVQRGTTSFVGKRQRGLNSTATVTLQLQDRKDQTTKAGLALYKEDCRHVEIYYDYSTCEVGFHKEHKILRMDVLTQKALSPPSPRSVAFRIRATGHKYDFDFRGGDEQDWTLLGSVDAKEMTGCDFSGPILGIFASTIETETTSPVIFEDFDIQPN